MIDIDKPYIDDSGKVWNTYQEYCNSPDLDGDIIGVMLATHRRQPQNEYEKALQEECDRYTAGGTPFEFPFD